MQSYGGMQYTIKFIILSLLLFYTFNQGCVRLARSYALSNMTHPADSSYINCFDFELARVLSGLNFYALADLNPSDLSKIHRLLSELKPYLMAVAPLTFVLQLLFLPS